MHEFLRGQVAQSVEQGTENPRVGGSIPSLTTYLFFLSFSLSPHCHEHSELFLISICIDRPLLLKISSAVSAFMRMRHYTDDEIKIFIASK